MNATGADAQAESLYGTWRLLSNPRELVATWSSARGRDPAVSEPPPGSRSASSSMEPLRSANSTVTCLRSPSRAPFEVRIFSARCLGV